MSNKVHYQTLEAYYFEDFIISTLALESNLTIEKENQNLFFDGFVQNGIEGYFSYPAFIDIRYSNNINLVYEKLEQLRTITDRKVCFIGMFEESKIYEDYAILGADFVIALAEKKPQFWWNFLCCVDNDAELILSNDGLNAVMEAEVLGTRQRVVLGLDKIELLSEMNEHEFIRLIRNKREPALIIGNGASIPFGSDPWNKMVDGLFDYLSPHYIDDIESVKRSIGATHYFSSSMTKCTIPEDKYSSAIWNSVYKKYESRMHTDNTLIHAITEIKYRNQTMPLFTYNYDEFIENDMATYHPDCKMVGVYDWRTDKDNNEPKIKHLHGVCIYKEPDTQKIILTDDEYYQRYKGNSWVVNEQERALKENVCLYVGSSMTDLFQLSLIAKIKKDCDKEEFLEKNGVWKCFALMCLKGLTGKDKLSINKYYLSKGIRLIFVDSFAKLPYKLSSLFAD